MKYFVHILNLIRGNIQYLLIKVINRKNFSYHPFMRFYRNVDIKLDSQSKITFGRGFLVASNSVISSTEGGYLKIGNMVGVNRNSMIMCHNNISIGDNTIMGPGVYIYDHDHVFESVSGVKRNEFKSSSVSIGKNCWIGAGSIILRGTKIGDNCLIAAGSVVKGIYKSGSVVIQKKK